MILGLSHVFGESSQPQALVAYWKAHGFKLDFEWDLPVPESKKNILINSSAGALTLSYLSEVGQPQNPGLEIVCHGPALSQIKTEPPKSRITLGLKKNKTELFCDPDNNSCVTHPDFLTPATIFLKTPIIKTARTVFVKLGFRETTLLPPAGLPLENQAMVPLSFNHPLFINRALTLYLIHDASFSQNPTVDEPGLQGLSFLVKSMDDIEKIIPLTAHQTLSPPGVKKRDVAFYSNNGLLLEFLKIHP